MHSGPSHKTQPPSPKLFPGVSRVGVPGQGSSPQFLHPLAGFVPELLLPLLASCPPAPLHLAVPYPHLVLSGDDYSQKSHAQPPGQYPVAKVCQSDLCPERQITRTLALGPGPLPASQEVLPSIAPIIPSQAHSCQPLPPPPVPTPAPATLHRQGFIHPFPDTSLQKHQNLAKTNSIPITIPVWGLNICTRNTPQLKGMAPHCYARRKVEVKRHFSFGEWESLKTWFVGSWPQPARANCHAELLRWWPGLHQPMVPFHLHKGVGWAGEENPCICNHLMKPMTMTGCHQPFPLPWLRQE